MERSMVGKPIACLEGKTLIGPLHEGQGIAVAQRNAFRRAGRARGVEDVGQIVFAYFLRGGCAGG